jgi:hypothetical protein
MESLKAILNEFTAYHMETSESCKVILISCVHIYIVLIMPKPLKPMRNNE